MLSTPVDACSPSLQFAELWSVPLPVSGWLAGREKGAYTCIAWQGSCSTAADRRVAGLTPAVGVQVAQEVFGLSRVVRTFGTEDREVGRYRRCLQALRNINVRQACAYLMYLIAASSLFNLTKASSPMTSPNACALRQPGSTARHPASLLLAGHCAHMHSSEQSH